MPAKFSKDKDVYVQAPDAAKSTRFEDEGKPQSLLGKAKGTIVLEFCIYFERKRTKGIWGLHG